MDSQVWFNAEESRVAKKLSIHWPHIIFKIGLYIILKVYTWGPFEMEWER